MIKLTKSDNEFKKTWLEVRTGISVDSYIRVRNCNYILQTNLWLKFLFQSQDYIKKLLHNLAEQTAEECFLWIALNKDSRCTKKSTLTGLDDYLMPRLDANLRSTKNIRVFALENKTNFKDFKDIQNDLPGKLSVN